MTALVGLLTPGPVASTPAAEATAESGAAGWTIDTVAGSGEYGVARPCGSDCGDGGPATGARLAWASDVDVDDGGNLYVADRANHRIRRVDPAGTMTTVAGDGTAGYSGDDGPATSAQLKFPGSVVVDGHGNIYIRDGGNYRVRKVSPSGVITTVAGTGAWGSSGDGGPATQAKLSPSGHLAVDAVGNLYLADAHNHRIRKVDTAGTITTVAGTGVGGFSGDGGPATSAQLNGPFDVSLDDAGALYIADSWNNRVRKVDASGVITTVAGNGSGGFDGGSGGGDGGPATSASLYYPSAVAVHGSGNLFISEHRSNAIRRVDVDGIIDTVAGSGFTGFYGDGGYAGFAALNRPAGLALDADGNLYIGDNDNNRVRRLRTSYLRADPSPGRVKVGEIVTYQLSLSGLPTTATGVSVSATLAREMRFVGMTASQGSCAEVSGTVTCELGTVGRGETASALITATALQPGVIPVTAVVDADDAGGIPGHRTVTASSKISAAACGQVLSASTVLSGDVGPCTGDGVIVGADAITVDLGGHRIFGFAGPGDSTEAGIRLPRRARVTVTNGTVSDFDAGVAIYGGRANTVRNMVVRENVGPDDPFNAELGDGIFVFESPDNTIAHNIVVGNGIFDGIGVWGPQSDRNRVDANRVEDTVGPSDDGPSGQGIIVNGADENDSTISGTVVSKNISRRNGSAGIANINNVDAQVLSNVVENNGFTNQAGNGIGVQKGIRARSLDTRVRIEGNQIHGNAEMGIDIRSQLNTIKGNDASDNAVDPRFGSAFDLFDWDRYYPDCGSNTWSGNIWGSGGYSPECTTASGRGPTMPPGPTSVTTSGTYPPSRRAPSYGQR